MAEPSFSAWRRRAVAFAVLAAGLSVASCSLAPAYKAPSVTAPAAYREQGPWTEVTPADRPAAGPWWTLFGDPVLSDLETRIDRDSPRLAEAVARHDQAAALLGAVEANGQPELDGLVDPTRNRQSNNRPLRGGGQPDTYDANTLGAALNWDPDLWGRLRNQVSATRALLSADTDDLDALRLSLEASLASDYFELRGLDAQIRVLGAAVTAYQRALHLTQTRFDGGVANGLDVSRAQTVLSRAEAEIHEVEIERALVQHAIAVLVGATPADLHLDLADAPTPVPEVPAGAPSSLIRRRPDIAAAERRVFAANAEIGVAKAAFFPSLTLTALGGYQNTGGPSLISAPNSYWSVGPAFALALFDGGRRKALAGGAVAARDAAAAAYRARVLAAFQQVEDSLVITSQLAAEQDDVRRAAASAERAQTLAMDRYIKGAATYLDVVSSQQTALSAEQAQIDLTHRRLQASVGLIHALGGGWTAAAAR